MLSEEVIIVSAIIMANFETYIYFKLGLDIIITPAGNVVFILSFSEGEQIDTLIETKYVTDLF